MMTAVKTLLSGDVHQLHNPGKGEANATGRYPIPVFHAKEKNNHHFYTMPDQDTGDQFAGLTAPLHLQVLITKGGTSVCHFKS